MAPPHAAQLALVALSLVSYPSLILLWDKGYLAAPLVAGCLLAAAALSGPRPLCPVRAGAVHGAAALAALAATGYLPLEEALQAAAALVYYGSTPSAISGALVLLAWKLFPPRGKP